ncbi:MAG: BlaI/MecI/CopY family transcriptional regulator [Tannerellaceae bacterium]|jgi:predicted transcriptional regulator|nr:BlaI/MecI/CopY family transcriptional regulator [Tannerellaceae bacterium]
MERLTPQEETVMLEIWQNEPCYIKDILEKYPEPRPPYTTVASIVKNLERKKYVSSVRYGNTCRYASLVSEGEYKRKFMSGIVRNYFADSYKEMVSFFAQEQKISAADLADIIRMIEEGKR